MDNIQAKRIIQLYKDGFSSIKIAKLENIEYYKIIYVLKKNNILIRSAKESHKVIFNERYFEKIDSEAKAYFLGLMAADGQVQNAKNHQKLMRIDLQEEDCYILEKFAEELGFQKNRVKAYKRKSPNKNIGRLIAYSDALCKDLSKFNVVPKKSFTYEFPNEQIPKELVCHFIRGYFDGDGCITVGPTTKIVGTEKFLLYIQNYFFENLGLSKTKLQIRHKDRNNTTRCLENGGRNKIKKIYNFLYKDANVFLTRKKNKFLKFIEEK